MYKRDSAHQGLERLQGTEFFTEYNRKKKEKRKKNYITTFFHRENVLNCLIM